MLLSDGRSERAIFIIDKTGVIRYVDVHDIDLQPDNEVLFHELAEIEGVPFPEERIPPPAAVQPAAVQPASAQAVSATSEEPQVTMYCTDWCPGCRRARTYFKINNIAIKEVNISRDREAAARVRTWTGGYETTPTFDVKGTIVVNFDIDKLNKLLGIPG